MPRCTLCCVSILALLVATASAHAAEATAGDKPVLRRTPSPPSLNKNDCETRIRKLDASDAEGNERLAEKRDVIEQCFSQYKHDKTIEQLVKDCAKYEEQSTVKRQFVAECQLAAFNYANALRTLKAGYRK